jgi:hypothetical protein
MKVWFATKLAVAVNVVADLLALQRHSATEQTLFRCQQNLF